VVSIAQGPPSTARPCTNILALGDYDVSEDRQLVDGKELVDGRLGVVGIEMPLARIAGAIDEDGIRLFDKPRRSGHVVSLKDRRSVRGLLLKVEKEIVASTRWTPAAALGEALNFLAGCLERVVRPLLPDVDAAGGERHPVFVVETASDHGEDAQVDGMEDDNIGRERIQT